MEKLMQYVWQHRLFSPIGLKTVDGRRINIINPGLLNTESGPDFFNASVEIDGQKWVGNVEIHVRASDWSRHGHHNDHAYDSVILHVVDIDDTPVHRPNGQIIPQMKLPCTPDLNSQFHRLTDPAPADLPCRASITKTPKIYLTDWFSALAYERVHAKADRILRLLDSYHGDWSETAYVTLARALGFGVNSEPFERLARSLPMRFLRKHSDDLLAVEALFLGQAGLIPQSPPDFYTERLGGEYRFLANKFGLRAPAQLGWKFAGTRPQNMPYRRIALLAALVASGKPLMSYILDADDAENARKIFNIPLSNYWQNHYSPGGTPTENGTNLSRTTTDLLIINCLVPLLFAYSESVGDSDGSDRAIDILHTLRPEKNRLVSIFADAGIKIPDAFFSQAVIQLRREYCEKRKCLYCRIGHRHLAACAIRQ